MPVCFQACCTGAWRGLQIRTASPPPLKYDRRYLRVRLVIDLVIDSKRTAGWSSWYFDFSCLQTSRLLASGMSHVNESKSSVTETGKGGQYVRKDTVFRNWVKEGGEFPPEGESSRETLYVSHLPE